MKINITSSYLSYQINISKLTLKTLACLELLRNSSVVMENLLLINYLQTFLISFQLSVAKVYLTLDLAIVLPLRRFYKEFLRYFPYLRKAFKLINTRVHFVTNEYQS